VAHRRGHLLDVGAAAFRLAYRLEATFPLPAREGPS
jgi:hypothetical protein